MTRLRVSPPFNDGESLTSYCSRLAAANNVSSSRTFAQHMGISYRSVALEASDAVQALSTLSGTPVTRLSTGAATRVEKEFHINGEIISDTFYNRSAFRFCPHCLREDLTSKTGPTEARPYGRLAWHVTFIRTCHVHDVALATHPTSIGIEQRDDFSAIWRGFSAEDQAPECSAMMPTNFERYVLRRIRGGKRSASWIDSLPLYVAGHLAETVGASINQGKEFRAYNMDLSQWAAAGETGYQVLLKGKDAFVEVLNQLQDQFLLERKRSYAGPALYGTLYRRLETVIGDVNYDVIREIVRMNAIETLPFGPDDLLFGKLNMPRRLHSIQTASKKSGIPVKGLKSRLLHVGLIEKADMKRTPHRVFMDATAVESLLNEILNPPVEGLETVKVALNEAMGILGVGCNHWKSVSHAFDLRPDAYARVMRTDIKCFLESLKNAATVVEPAPGWLDVLAAASRLAVDLGSILRAILAGDLASVWVDLNEDGLAQIYVDPVEIDATLRGGYMKERMTSAEVAKLLQIDDDSLGRLSRTGLIKRERAPGAAAGFVYSVEEVQRFSSQYVSLRRLSDAAGLYYNTMANLLRDHGIFPAFGEPGRMAKLYRISCVRRGPLDEAVLASLERSAP